MLLTRQVFNFHQIGGKIDRSLILNCFGNFLFCFKNNCISLSSVVLGPQCHAGFSLVAISRVQGTGSSAKGGRRGHGWEGVWGQQELCLQRAPRAWEPSPNSHRKIVNSEYGVGLAGGFNKLCSDLTAPTHLHPVAQATTPGQDANFKLLWTGLGNTVGMRISKCNLYLFIYILGSKQV